jgi:transposase-like protein
MSEVNLGFDKHELECPYCQKQTLYLWPGKEIPFARVTCQHCGREFLTVQNEPRKEKP